MLARLLGVRIFDVEASSHCNVKCRYCPRDLLPEKGLMSQKTFSRFLAGVKLGPTDTVSFIGMGEPTLNPHLPGFVRQVKERCPKTRTWVTTNGTNLNEKTVLPLLEVGLDTLDISFNGLQPVVYELNMRGASFEQTLANIEYARREAEHAGGRTQVQINYIVTAENTAQEGFIRDFWRARGIARFRVQRMHNRGGDARVEGMSPVEAAGLSGRRCLLFETMHFVTWKGEVHYCAHDMRRAHVIGDINAEPWAAIEVRKREITAAGRWPAMCARCTDPLRHDVRQQIDAMIRRELAGRVAGGLRSLRQLAAI